MALSKIVSASITSNVITSALIANGEITITDLAPLSLNASVFAAGTITGDKIATSQITGNLLAETVTTGNINFGGVASFLGTVNESANVTTLMGANTTINISSPFVVFTSNSSANSTVNFTGLSGVSAGNSSSFVIVVPNSSTPKYINAYQVDGSAVTPKWQGGAPVNITPANTDIYMFTIIKTSATPTYNIFASVASYF